MLTLALVARARRPARSASSWQRRACARRRRSLSLLECGARVPARSARASAQRALGAPPRGRRHDAARDVPASDRRLRPRPEPGRPPPLPPASLRRLVGRGPALADVQPLPPRRLRRRSRLSAAASEALWRSTGRLPRVRVHRVQRRAGRARPRLGDLPARRHGQRDERLRISLAAAASCLAVLRRLRPGATITHHCIILICLYSCTRWRPQRSSACAGYAGQETLDRVLAHPELEPCRARLGLARRPAAPSALDPRLERRAAAVRHERRGARRAAPTSSSSASTTTRPPRSSRRPTRSSSTSPARTGSPTPTLARGLVRHRAGRVELRAARALPAAGAADREPRLLRDRGAARARRRSPAIDPTASSSTRSPASRAPAASLKASSHAGFVLENLSPYARRRRTGTRRRSRSSSASRSASCRTCCPCGAGCSPPVTCRPTPTCARCSRRRTRRRPVVRVLAEGVAPELSRVQRTDAAEIGVFEDRATGTRDRHLRARQPRQGRRRPGGAEREPRARPRRDRRACG